MTDHAALQETSSGHVSQEALGVAGAVLEGRLSLEHAIRRVAAHFLTEPRVEIVTVVLTRLDPTEQADWVQLGGRAWMFESARAGSSRTLLPEPGAGSEAALSMPWMSRLARDGIVALTDRDKLPPEASQDHEELARAGVHSLITSTFSAHGEMFGSMSLVGDEPGDWPAWVIQDFRILNAAITSRLTLEQSRRALAGAIHASTEAQVAHRNLFGAVGHELRTPISAVLGYTEGLIDDAEHGSVEEVVSGVLRDGPRIVRASEQLLAIVDSLLGAGRALAGDDGRSRVGVADAVADVVHWHRSPATTGGVEMTVDVDPEVTVWAHATAVRQVLTNLVGNAITHHRPGGGTVHVSAERLLGESGHPMVRIVVRDDGPGLDAEQLAHAFEPFVRFAADGRRGTGLGLSISRTMAERDGGAVRGESVPGTGSTFWLELPAVALASVQPASD